MNYTKGEWKAKPHCAIVETESHCEIAIVYDPNNGKWQTNEAEANTHLIAAAPALYELLKEGVECWRELGAILLAKGLMTQICEATPEQFKGDNNPFNKADKALAKAEGREL